MIKILFLSLMALSLGAVADNYFVNDASALGVGGDDARAITDLIKSSISETGSHHVVSEKSKAKYILRPKLMKLGSSYMLTIDKISDDKVIFSSQMKAAQIEEMDTVSARVTRAVIDESPVKTDARVQDVTESERVAGRNRRQAVSHWYFGFGPGFGSNLETSSTIFSWSLAYIWDIPSSSAALKLFWDGASVFNDFGIGGHYYFSDRDTSPFITLDMGYGASVMQSSNVTYLNRSASGFIVGGGVGIAFFRTTSVNLDLQLHYAHMLSRNSVGNPGFFVTRIGLNF